MSELWQNNAVETASLVKNGEVSATEVLESTLTRLDAVNPAINAVVQATREEAQRSAEQVTRVLAEGGDPGPLAGVPVTVKVNIDQAGYATTNGVALQRELVATDDHPVVANLRRAGALIVGRTNTPAFSLRWFCRNQLHGHTRNPRNPELTPGGSSGGASAATAAGIGAIAHGTDIAGSIRYPAYACGLYGLRPTLGRVPAVNTSAPDRQIGAQLMAVSGPLARSIADLRLGLAVMAAPDLRDPWWVPVPHEQPPVSRRAAVCVAPEGLDTAPQVVQALRTCAQQLQDAGWQVEERDCPPLRDAVNHQIRLWLAEFRRGGLDRIAAENDPDANFIVEQLHGIAGHVDADAVLDSLQARVELMRRWQLFLGEYPVLLCPVSGELPFPDLLDVSSPAGFARVWEAQLLQIGLPFMGMPAMTVPTGATDGRPLGVQLVAGRYREDVLFDVAELLAEHNPQPTICDP